MDVLSDQSLNLQSLFMVTVTTPQRVSSPRGSGEGLWWASPLVTLLCKAHWRYSTYAQVHETRRRGFSPCWPLLAWAQEPHVRANSTTHYLCDFWQMCHIFKFCCSFNPLLEFSVPSLSHRKLVLLHNSLWGHGLLPILTLNIKRTIYEFAHTLGVFVEVELRGWMIFTHNMFLKIYLYYF